MTALAGIVKALDTGVPATTKISTTGPVGLPYQTVVDELVDEIARKWNLQRSDLGIIDA